MNTTFPETPAILLTHDFTFPYAGTVMFYRASLFYTPALAS